MLRIHGKTCNKYTIQSSANTIAFCALVFYLKKVSFMRREEAKAAIYLRVRLVMKFLTCGYKISLSLSILNECALKKKLYFVNYIIMLPTRIGHNSRE